MEMLINTIFYIVMHRDTLNAKYDADGQVKRLVWSMGKTFQKLSANKKFFLFKIRIIYNPDLYYIYTGSESGLHIIRTQIIYNLGRNI